MKLTQEKSTTDLDGTPARGPLERMVNAAYFGVLAVLLIMLLAKDGASLDTTWRMFQYPFQFDESEGMIVAETMLLDRGVQIYDIPGPSLFVAAPYPPLYYLLNWPVQHLAGAEPTFKGGRAITILASGLAGLALAGLVFAVVGSWLGAALAAAAWWSLGLTTFWGSLVKPDMLAVALGLGGLWWLLARPPPQVWWALPFFLGAFYCKQTAIAAGVAGVGWLIWTRPRTGVAFGAAYGAGALAPSLLLNWLTGGGYFYHMFTIHDLPWSAEAYSDFILKLLGDYWFVLVPGLVAILVAAFLWLLGRLRRGEGEILPRQAGLLLVLYALMSLVVATGTGTHGGNHNHLLDLAAAGSLGLGLGAGLVAILPSWKWRAALAAAGLVLISQAPLLFATPEWLKLEFGSLAADKVAGMTNIFQYVTNDGGPAYSDNVGLMLSTRKQLWTTDPFTQTHATKYHRWDESRLVAAIGAKHFSQIILRIDVHDPQAGAGDVSPGILQAVRDNYKLDQRNVENIYVPR